MARYHFYASELILREITLSLSLSLSRRVIILRCKQADSRCHAHGAIVSAHSRKSEIAYAY